MFDPSEGICKQREKKGQIMFLFVNDKPKIEVENLLVFKIFTPIGTATNRARISVDLYKRFYKLRPKGETAKNL